ncbi:uncharacterized protein LOC144948080 [Lampetra fluviatilis]
MCVCARGVCVWWSGGTSESDSPLSLVTVTTFVDCGGLKFLLSLLKHHACQGLMLRFESKNTLRFAITTLYNLSVVPELKPCFLQERAADVMACYLDVPDAPCKLCALETLARISTEQDLDIICNAQGAIALLTELINRPSYKGKVALENILNPTAGLVESLTMISITAGIRRKTLQPGAKLDEEALQEILPELREKLKVETERRDYTLEWGDIAVHPTRPSMQKWPKARDGRIYIPYKVSLAFYERDVKKIEEAALEFEKKTCVRFIPRPKDSKEADYIYIHAREGNWSFLGRQGGDQVLSLEPGKVSKGVVLHEFMHALGFHHEHCRSDRDAYINVLSDNVKPEWVDAIVKKTSHEHNLTTPYDYSSVTHYGISAGSKDEHSLTMTPKDTKNMRRFGGSHVLSDGDVMKIGKMFGLDVAAREPRNPAPAQTHPVRAEASSLSRDAGVSSHKITLPQVLEKKEKEFTGCGVKESSLSRPVRHWPKSGDGRVYIPYKVSKDFYDYDVKAIEQAVEEFEKKTHMRFRPHGKETDFIHIQALEGSLSKSWSYVGRQGGAQDLSLEPGKVTKGTVLHELMHALGFQHEHCRSDRDDHVWVVPENMKPEWHNQIFTKKSHAHDVSAPYDCSSIMHYSMTAGSVDERNPTIIPKNPVLMLHMGHGNSLSPCDIVKVQKLYGFPTTRVLNSHSADVIAHGGLENHVNISTKKTEEEVKEEKAAKVRALNAKGDPVVKVITEVETQCTYDISTVPRLEKLLELLSAKRPAQEKEVLHTAYREGGGPELLKKILEFPKAESYRIPLLLVVAKIVNVLALQAADEASEVLRTGDIAGDPLEKIVEWPKHRDGNVYIPYNISIAFSARDKKVIEQAFQEYHSKTCIRFTPRKLEEEHYINFQALDGNWSFLGQKGGAQSVSLEPDKVTKGTVLHELMHALGFQHEHCRSDRDKYITVQEDNIKEDEQRQFRLLETSDFELPYDYMSITHYDRCAFSVDGRSPTIIPKSETVTIGQRDCLSTLDVIKIQKMYKNVVAIEIARALPEDRKKSFQELRKIISQVKMTR